MLCLSTQLAFLEKHSFCKTVLLSSINIPKYFVSKMWSLTVRMTPAAPSTFPYPQFERYIELDLESHYIWNGRTQFEVRLQ